MRQNQNNMNCYCRFLTAVLLSASLVLGGCGQQAETETSSEETSQAVVPPVVNVDKNKVVGNWVRADAPYQLSISELTEGGSMKAAYFNPKEIHVGKAFWTDQNQAISVYVELRDVNYPGSNYTLSYVPGQDILSGKYFQAVEGATYDVIFTRVK